MYDMYDSAPILSRRMSKGELKNAECMGFNTVRLPFFGAASRDRRRSRYVRSALSDSLRMVIAAHVPRSSGLPRSMRSSRRVEHFFSCIDQLPNDQQQLQSEHRRGYQKSSR
jgi:hypothetical protein